MTRIKTKKIYKMILTAVFSKSFTLALLLLVLLELFFIVNFDRNFHLYFLDVAQGDSILIKTPDYKYILIDGGEGSDVLEELGEIIPFWIRKIDLVIGTHADSDHIEGLTHVLEAYEVDTFITSDLDVSDSNLKKIKEIAEKEGVNLGELDTGNSIVLGDLKLEVLWPDEDFEFENDNQNSLVLLGDYKDFEFLLTGDVELDQENKIIAEYKLDVDLLKVSHHGSKTASSEEFIEAINPEFAVISCGVDNKFGHPSDEIVDRISSKGVELFRTDRNGLIEFIAVEAGFNYKLEKN